MKRILPATALLIIAVIALSVADRARAAAPFVPGTGEFLKDCCDDFEDANWGYRYNHPKSSHEQDENQRGPGGMSTNGLWHEGGKRGTPDVVKRIETPAGGLDGSLGALMFATKNSGIPGKVTNSQQQDDLLMMCNRRLGRSIPIAWQPSCTVRVYLPEWEKWEQRTGPSFGMRADCSGRNPDGTTEEYWPGMFILFQKQTNKEGSVNSAKLTIRGDRMGHDVRNIDFKEPGWVTLGMSFTSDGQVHYYGKPGIEDLTAEDHLMSSFPYSMKAVVFNNFFFNVANWDTGRTWSTPWVIDDPKVYVIPPQGQTVAQLYRVMKKPQIKKQVARNKSVQQPGSVVQPGSTPKPSTATRSRTQK